MTRIEPTVSPARVDRRDSAMGPRVAPASDGPSDARPIGGIWPAVLTMFDAAGAIDERGTARHVEYLLRHGARGLVAAGTSGEFIALDNDERLRVIRVVIDAAAGRVPVYAGTGHYATRHTITMTEQADRAGAAGVIVILPYFQKPPKPAVLEHFRAVRAATSLPLMLYNNPANSACVELTSRDVAALAEEGVIQSVKSTFESCVPVHDLLHRCGDRLRVFYGSFQSPMEAILGGAHGWISGFLNFLTADCVALFDAASRGDVAQAHRIWHRLLPFKQLFSHQSLGPVNDLAIWRAGLDLLGEHGGHSRLPFEPLTRDQRQALETLMRRQGVLA
ncbi:MAG: dihydrodipicolinate synthase family protein [Actinomycetota bacterium]